MDILYLCIAFLVIAIFIMKLELLLEPSSFKMILGFAAAAFALGVYIHFTLGDRDSAAGLMFAPLPVLGYFCVLRRLFLKWAHREPINTAANWAPGLAKDRTFALAFLCGSLAIMFLTMVAAERFSTRGW